MKTISDLMQAKLALITLYRSDVVSEEDDPDWKKNHPLGPIHVQIRCLCCNEILERDLREYGWLHNDSFWLTKITPHIKKHCGYDEMAAVEDSKSSAEMHGGSSPSSRTN